jgi:Ca-activated chloride channel family protein
MSFMWPVMLWLLLLIPLLIIRYVLVQRRRRSLAASYGSMGFVQNSSGRAAGFRRHIPQFFFLAGIGILLFALARPQAVVSLPRVEGTVILAFDVSGSMAADDLQPTRMDAAKAAARDFVARQPATVQIGVVGFSDSGFSEQAPTYDRDAINNAITRLKPLHGTSVAHGIQASLNILAAAAEEAGPPSRNNSGDFLPTPTPTPTPVPKGKYAPAVIVLLSDGENNESPDPLQAAQMAADRGVRIYTVGIGTAAGTTLHINGFYVFTQLDEATLQQIADITGGTYYNADSTQELLNIYDTLDPQLIVRPIKTEITSLFAGAGILALLMGGALTMLWFNRLP